MSNLNHCVDNRPNVLSVIYYKRDEIHTTCMKLCSLKFPDDFAFVGFRDFFDKLSEKASYHEILLEYAQPRSSHRKRYVDVVSISFTSRLLKPKYRKLFIDKITEKKAKNAHWFELHEFSFAIKTCSYDEIMLQHLKETYEKNKFLGIKEEVFSKHLSYESLLKKCLSFNLVRSAKFIIENKPDTIYTVINQINFFEREFSDILSCGYMNSIKLVRSFIIPPVRNIFLRTIKYVDCCSYEKRWLNEKMKSLDKKKTIKPADILYNDEEDIVDNIKQIPSRQLLAYFAKNHYMFDPNLYPVTSSILMKNLACLTLESRDVMLCMSLLSCYKDIEIESKSLAKKLICYLEDIFISPFALRYLIEKSPVILSNMSVELTERFVKNVFRQIKETIRVRENLAHNMIKESTYKCYNHVRNNINNKLNQEILRILIPFDLKYTKYITNLDDLSTDMIISYV